MQLPKKLSLKYKCNTKLGSGASGQVFSGLRVSDKLPVAVKVIPRSTIPSSRLAVDKDPYGKTIILPMEVYILRRVSHPGVVKLVDFGQDQSNFFIITELHGSRWSRKDDPGPVDLFECIDSRGNLSEEIARDVLCQLASVLKYLKSKHVYHLDLKDENIVIDDNYKIKVIDFGSAEIIDPSTKTLMDSFRGTVAYAPPEVLLGRKFSPESCDLWTVGVVFYTMLYGQNPYSSLKNAIAGTFTPTSRKVEVSSNSTHILKSLLACNPLERASIDDLYHALEEVPVVLS